MYPPSTTSTEPVVKDAASLTRWTTLGAISSGVAYRRIGASSIQCCRNGGSPTGALPVFT